MTPLTTRPDGAALAARHHAHAVVVGVPRLLGLDGHRVRGQRAARPAHRRGHLARRDQPVEPVPERRLRGTSLGAPCRTSWCEFLEISHWVAPVGPAALARGPASTREARDPHGLRHGGVRFLHDEHPATSRAPPRSPPTPPTPGTAAPGRLPGLRPPRARRAARGRASRPATCPATCTRRPTPVVGEEVAGESHAWIEWWDGDWVGFDPTNAGTGRRAARPRRARPRLRGRPAAARHLLHPRRLRAVRRRRDHPHRVRRDPASTRCGPGRRARGVGRPTARRGRGRRCPRRPRCRGHGSRPGGTVRAAGGRSAGVEADHGVREEQLQQRPDRERVEHGAQPDGAAEQEAHGEHGDLERRADQPDGEPVRRTRPVIRPSRGPGAELGADVEGAGQAVEHHAADEQGAAGAEGVGGVQQPRASRRWPRR